MTDPVDLLADLIAIESVNPALVPGGAGEARIAAYCADWLVAHGFEVHRLEAHPGRPSVVGIARGTGGGRSLLLNGHVDTVTLAGYDGEPLTPYREDGKIFGRGAFDMKSGVAAMMAAAARAVREGPLRGDVLVACVADEEHGSLGTEEVLASFTADAAVVTEPSHLELTLAHKGFAWFEVTIEGRAAHGSRPELGVDAIAKAGHFLVELEAYGARLAPHPRLGPGTVHASLISGGEEASSYPARCTITLERRTVPGETAATVETELREILDRLAATVPGFRYRLERGLERAPFEADPASPIVACVADQVRATLGRDPVIRAEPFWTDCALLDAAGIPCLMIGADGGGAHSATEWADTASLHHLTAILTGTIRTFCG
ncbi:acetylornithine deacetylase [Thermocatellispora tengchongensis]|uniref:Probable succinyl-diaminopimelate desuccinylase n=1 Tax=Thermocatellispora tengchongensis TaxID=1073253 RepID=A0A840NYD1_9ACTN|nr:ArgE/DapE family deacylase [Thermocatellispora tengchongensis]MBB5130703.1 acetylornithine deacetylase [Thermocatellispora tengchongensis]